MNAHKNLEQTFIALNRFGYGPSKKGLHKTLSSDPQAFLKRQISSPRIPKHLSDQGGIKYNGLFLSSHKDGTSMKRKKYMRALIKDYRNFVSDIMMERMMSTQPFIERLTAFWSNHFTISLDKFPTAGLFYDYEYRAIRPNIMGRFSDLLIAVTMHPAMLAYLDNMQSFGPNSDWAGFMGRGLNENLAREILELHTLGVDSGYTQKDVRELAKIITGWSFHRDRQTKKITSKFHFHPQLHEPGSKTLLGQTFRENGLQEGKDALSMLARHPATRTHICTKLATHFISDNPPPSLIKTLETVWEKTDGDLQKVSEALITAPESWEEPLSKIKPTPDFVISAFRAFEYTPNQTEILSALETLDYKAYKASSPKGYSDKNEDWAAPGALIKRVEWAQEMALRADLRGNPYTLGQKLFGPVMDGPTAFALQGAESAQQGMALLLMAPEFQRR